MKRWRPLFLALVVVAILAAIWSYVMIATPPQKTLDQKVQDVASQLKCPVCQDESVADSPSLIAQQMRAVIRQQLQSGESEQQVIDYFVSRYGQQILWSPPWQGFSMLAYLVPFGLFTGGCILLFFILRDWSASSLAPGAKDSGENDSGTDTADLDEADLALYRQQLEAELAADDPVFASQYLQHEKQQTEAG
jgi:cytochrome c-type biogenesis protein CcmH